VIGQRPDLKVVVLVALILSMSPTKAAARARNHAASPAYGADDNNQQSNGNRARGQVVRFELYSGNTSLAPQYRHILTVRGQISANTVVITYTRKDGDDEREGSVTLEGERFRKCAEMLRNTRIEVIRPADRLIGGSSFDVTLMYRNGKSVMGNPSNRSEWEEFAQGVSKNER
jgi:hypothetical protein